MKFLINGGKRLCGAIDVQGAKNSILPILSACVLCSGEVVLHNCPILSDVTSAINILNHLGIKTEIMGNDIRIQCTCPETCAVPEKLMREMRSSVVFLGAILSRMGCAQISMPGGCELGPRPIDMHLSALKKLGAVINEEGGVLRCSVPEKLRGCEIDLSFPSVGATENIILASSLSSGTTVITNAAREPEIVDLALFLNRCGAKISGMGSSTIVIEGVKKLCGCEYSVMPDRIVSVTFLAAAAATRGDVLLKGARKEDIISVLSLLEEAGCDINIQNDEIRMRSPEKIGAFPIIKTMPYPGFPTDAQAPMMALSTICEGTTMFVETIFENRYRHVDELVKMGANIKTEGKVAVVSGVSRLHGAEVNCTDLRGGAALLIASLSANGQSKLSQINHIDRGYQFVEKELCKLGADVKRIS